jgi:hypothetical protein
MLFKIIIKATTSHNNFHPSLSLVHSKEIKDAVSGRTCKFFAIFLFYHSEGKVGLAMGRTMKKCSLTLLGFAETHSWTLLPPVFLLSVSCGENTVLAQ